MSQKEYLNGKVSIQEVECLSSRDGFSLTSFSRLETSTAELTFFPFEEPIHSITLVTFKVGDTPVIRGNHVHNQKDEYLYITAGRFKGKYIDLDTMESVTLDLKKGDLIHVLPNCSHAYMAQEDASFLEFTPTKLTSWDSTASDVAKSPSDFLPNR